MPNSTIRAFEATTSGYESAEEIRLKPHKAKVVVQKRSLKDLALHSNLPPSPADSETTDEIPSADEMTPRRLTSAISRGSLGDQGTIQNTKSLEEKRLAKKRSQYYEEAFASREVSLARERVSRESVIMADVRTNVIIQDEYTFITDLSYTLSTRYQRPESCVIVTVAHSACLLFGGSFDPAYSMSITALQCQLQPVTNKRNASLLQRAMEDALGVIPERGTIRFIPIAEENLATNGKTVAGDIDDLEREGSEDTSTVKRSLSRNKFRYSTKSMRNLRIGSPLPTHDESLTPPATARTMGSRDSYAIPPIPEMPAEKSTLDLKAEKMQKMGRRKSFINTLLGKGERLTNKNNKN